MSATMTPPAQAAAPAEEEKGGGKKKLIMIVVLLLVVGGAGYWFFLKPKPAGADKPVPGEVLRLDPIQVNLSGGHYLKIGVALQLTAKAHEADGAMALDATIDTFSGKSMDALTRPDNREKLKAHLEKELEHLYHGDVMGVYFTDFVTQ
jgi:flagellar FliL protein